ncbi:restriction endonuclease [Bradyrhizobium tropiciagri]|uniref:restriction endonuclease n=1 Tax=Bradyrhizobium tropiciagri TaxID=312253 RepID=UPI001BA97179|nr:restriction endonuclease [Bradyrhizobium tropiciagri]MBR0870305.1 restriction endonuclease [Bradyrhizobium tropiciagri]
MAATRVNSSIVTGLKRLPPEQFENLTYDVLLLSGVQNLRWRTPAADGGRDLEGDVVSVDFSGETVRQRWYIECKRYNQSIDWSTVYGKLTVAINHQADYLLLVTTSNVSVPCRDEIQRHNERRGVQIRVWPFYYLEQLLTVHGQVAVKYGLVKNPQTLHVDFERIISELMKLAQATDAAVEFGQKSRDRVTLIAVFTELISKRIEDVRKHGRFITHRFKPDRDTFEWCKPAPLPADRFDATSLRAALATIKNVLGLNAVECRTDDGNLVITVATTAALRTNALFSLVSTFGMIDWHLESTEITLKAR